MDTQPTRKPRHVRGAVAVALAVALTLATACSSDTDAGQASEPQPATETPLGEQDSAAEPALDDLATFLTDCMRDQGIDQFPEAETLPDGSLDLDMSALDAAGIGPGSPEFNTAFAACESIAGQSIELGDHTGEFSD